jgi:flavin reductase (DIM6/NTAB) family NADH-FMN oxidoreductase RutF
MRHIDPKEVTVPEVFGLLLSGVAPRPIALVATVSENGEANLSPFSFFNAFGSNPPYVAFSPSTRVRDGSKKDTYYNLIREKECTIQVVTHDMVEQVNLASTEYETGVNEFVKSGLTPVPSDLVKPPRVKESPFQMECVLDKEVPLGDGKGSGNLMICRVLKFHVSNDIYGDKGIDPKRLDLVARMGANYYTRASGEAVFEVEKPLRVKGMGYDCLPDHVKTSQILSANDLAQLANANTIPSDQEVAAFVKEIKNEINLSSEIDLLSIFSRSQRIGEYRKMLAVALTLKDQSHPQWAQKIAYAAQAALRKKDRDFAWKSIMITEY